MADTPPHAEVVGYAPEPLRAFAYVSTPTVPFESADVQRLLLASRRVNQREGVTGKLVVLEDAGRAVHFAQWIEGPATGIAAVLARIRADARHELTATVFEGAVAARRFAGWDMAHVPVRRPHFASEAEALTTG